MNNYFEKQLEKNYLETKDIYEQMAEPIIVFLLFLYFIVNQFFITGFFLENFGSAELIFLYGPLFANILSSTFLIRTRSRQNGRVSSGLANLFTALGWAYLYTIDKWYSAPDLWIVGDFVSDDLFSILIILGIIVPLFLALSEFIIFYKVRELQE